MRRLRNLLCLVLICALSNLLAAKPNYYLRHRPVEGRVIENDILVPVAELGQYFSAEEMARIKVGPEKLLVEDEVVRRQDDQVPLVRLALALGFVERRSPQSGWVDLIPPTALQGPIRVSEAEREKSSMRREEYKIASLRMKKIYEQLPPHFNRKYRDRVERIGQKVADASPLGNIKWNFAVVDTKVPNAACVGEGHVFVTSGLLDLGISDDELAGVLGHEVAHGVRRHPFKRLDLIIELQRLDQAMKEYNQRLEAMERAKDEKGILTLQNLVREIQERARKISFALDNMRLYERKDEEEADVLGMRYAVAAGYSRDGLGKCLVKLENYQVERFGTAVLDVDLSHPPVKRRLEVLRRVELNWES